MKKEIIYYLSFLVSSIGVGDSLYLFIKHVTSGSVICTITQGCDKVLSSSYASVFGIPLAFFGVLFYILMLTITAASFFLTHSKYIQTGGMIFSIIGFMSSCYFVYLQIFVLQSICQYCMLSAATSTTLCILWLLLYIKHVKKQNSV